MKAKPTNPGEVVRFPGDPRRILRLEGEDVPDDDLYWTRRLLDRSITRIVEEPADFAHERAKSPGGDAAVVPLGAPVSPLTAR